MIVDIGIAINKFQSPLWWLPLFGELLRTQQRGVVEIGSVIGIGRALTDLQKNGIVNIFFGPVNTAENRDAIVAASMESKADAIFWVDDDTVPPHRVIERLLELDSDIAAGVYFMRTPPYHPLVYKRRPDKAYRPLFNYQVGEIIDVADSVGMGCTLVRRHVYERIRESYTLFKRADTASLIPIHKDDITLLPRAAKQVRQNVNRVVETREGIFRMQQLLPLGEEPARWPYYVMEHERTEDHHLCELARRVGCSILVDTALQCGHVGDKVYDVEDFREFQREYVQKVVEREAENAGS